MSVNNLIEEERIELLESAVILSLILLNNIEDTIPIDRKKSYKEVVLKLQQALEMCKK